MEETAAASGSSKAAVPWLVFPYGEGKENQAFYNIFEPNNTSYRMCIPELSRKSFWQKHSHQGWLIIICHEKDNVDDVDNNQSVQNWIYGDCFLWNLVTLETIQLPSLLYWMNKPDEFRMIDCVLSSPPRVLIGDDGDDDKDPIVLFLFLRQNDACELIEHVFLFCKPGDKQWRTQLVLRDIISMRELKSLQCFKGKLYAMGMNENHLEIEMQHQIGANDDDNSLTLSIIPFQVSFCTLFSFQGARDYPMVLTYFVECYDELFKIDMNCNERGSETVVTSILITRLDFSLVEWKVVNSLGDHVLFAGDKTACCCSAAGLGLARGCLYYTIYENQGLYKFDVESTDESVTLPGPMMPTSGFSSDWIMLPYGWGGKEDMLVKDEEKDYIQDEGVKITRTISYNENAILGEKQNIIMRTQLWCHYNSDISFSSLPTTADFIVFGIDVTGLYNSVTIYLIRRGEQDWHAYEHYDIEKYTPLYNTPTLFRGFFFSVGYDGTSGYLNTKDDPYSDFGYLNTKDDPYSDSMEEPCKLFNDSYPSFLVECGRKLLLVKLGLSVRVFRMDFSVFKWVEVESLGKHMLFISDILCVSAIAPPNSQMENEVYFPRLWLDGEGILYYSLETGNYHSSGGAMHSAKNIYGTRVGIQTAFGFNRIGRSPLLDNLTGWSLLPKPVTGIFLPARSN
ncbi:hypothetical protein MKX01_000931 [Papaver californicum]|nr:hypothetical protein MKX01_000931 [Papaver californicum]